jgi:NitT/TauT family transport system ATP-binding protein
VVSLIDFSDVSFHYDIGRPIIEHFNLRIDEGQFVVLIGPSGCGKTTALNLLAGFETPTSGQVKFRGATVERPSIDRPVVFQGDDSLYSWLTVEENVEFGLRMSGVDKVERRARSAKYLAMVGLAKHTDKFPHQLSGGMKQRVQLVRALVCDAAVILMDEPFGSLDAQTRAVLQDELAQISQLTKTTVLFITHDIGEAIILGDRVCVMRAGPGANVIDAVEVHLPRPRLRSDVGFGQLYERLHSALAEQAKIALAQVERAA